MVRNELLDWIIYRWNNRSIYRLDNYKMEKLSRKQKTITAIAIIMALAGYAEYKHIHDQNPKVYISEDDGNW